MQLEIDRESYASLLLELAWQSEDAWHVERYLARKVNIWRDFFPFGLKEELLGRKVGEKAELDYAPGDALPGDAPRGRRQIPFRYFRGDKLRLHGRHPSQGRFYPKGLLEHLPGIHPQNAFPFRVLEVEEEGMVVDLGHPLAKYPLRVTATVLDIGQREGDVGGRCTDWRIQAADKGPGMQAALGGMQADFSHPGYFRRRDETEDSAFYNTPRFVGHIDKQADELLQREHETEIEPESAVLDLMSSYESHLPLDRSLDVTGLGMNSEEMASNPALSRHVVHDLNARPELPFPNECFDVVLCSLSVEYMTRPAAVLLDAARVLRPAGRIGISFSNRWFPPKTISLWPDLYEFERLGYVLEMLRRTSAFERLHTVSLRNWWRPEQDKYCPSLLTSDPVFLAWGRRKA